MYKLISSVLVVLLGACSLVKEEKYIDTGAFRQAAYKLCLESERQRSKSELERQGACRAEADDFIASAEHKFREYKADEHNYRLCREKFANINASDKCFREQQEKYYTRELESYKAGLQ